jgi:hypothetical protein
MSKANGTTRQYATLIKVLDSLREEAPVEDTIYHPPAGNNDAMVQARSRALLHLFLKGRFGLTEFKDRIKYVTDGPNDGGIDAFYIDKANKRIYVLQSKFRATAANFSSVNMSVNDLLKMDVKDILNGKTKDEHGTPYNAQIKQSLQRSVKQLPDVGSYETHVILLGNSKAFSAKDLQKLASGYKVDQYHHERIFKELLFPVIHGTYFTDPDLRIEISLANTQRDSHLDYNVVSAKQKANIKLLFVPTVEIGRILHTYKNSILQYNPRSFLDLDKNPVNQEIAASIEDVTGNEFALYNNGITIVSEGTQVSSDTAKLATAQVVIRNPQLINGGQTAYTLSRIYQNCISTGDFSVFKGKEVLLKVISFVGKPKPANLMDRLDLITSISKASNSQTKIEESDRRSNDPIQLELQREFFESYGLFYERKRGEFSDGIHAKYINSDLIVNRENLVRVALASEYRITGTKSGIQKVFGGEALTKTLNIQNVAKYAYGYEILRLIEEILKPSKKGQSDKYNTAAYGQALRYGQFAVIAICINHGMSSHKSEKDVLNSVLAQWKGFEASIMAKPSNIAYAASGSFSFVNYYKGATVNADLKAYAFTV